MLAVNRTIDYVALTAPVDATEVKQFKARVRGTPEYSSTISSAQVVAALLAVVVGIFVFATVGTTLVSAFASMIESGLHGSSFLLILGPIVFVVTLVIVGVVWLRGTFGSNKWERWLRLERFASANGLEFSPSSANPSYPGAIFSTGKARKAVNHLRSASDRYFDFGNYHYTTGSGKSQTTHKWGFLALSLDRSLPHMVLDSKANNGLFGGTNLPTAFRKDQVLSLEGNFDEYFTLYCPNEYERDALYVFTPDLMALLIDNAAPFDVEIVDRWLFVYSASEFSPLDPAVYQRLFRIIDTIGAKALSQTDRYVDERIGDFAANIVAPAGRRLSRGASVAGIMAVIIAAVVWAWPFISGELFH